MRRLKRPAGFTLIELMIVVVIVGILAVLAVYGVRKYLSNAKTAEARNTLGQIAKSQAAQFEKDNTQGTMPTQGSSVGASRALCGGPDGPVPATTKIAGQKYLSSPADWNAGIGSATVRPTGFYCLLFSMDQPQYYSYSWAATGTAGSIGDTFTATANGDLNGDGVLSTFSMTGNIGSGAVLNIAANISEIEPQE